MDSETFSRSFLQGIPEQCKQSRIDQIIYQFINELKNAAAMGKTSYMYNVDNCRELNKHLFPGGANQTSPVITIDDLVSAFQKKFPDCNVSYKETWVDVDSKTMSLKKGIIIDWS
jgi:hypothetical protein